MKVVVVGGRGTIGSAIVQELSPRHEILTVGRSHGDISCDITSEESIKAMFAKIGPFDALISAAGNTLYEDFSHMTPEKFEKGLQNKLMGQVRLVMIGMHYINDHGSFTLTSGIIGKEPIRTGSSAAMVNGAIEGFVRGASIEMPKNLRINAISPTILTESMPLYAPYFRGFDPVPAKKVALAYAKSVEGLTTGQIYSVLY